MPNATLWVEGGWGGGGGGVCGGGGGWRGGEGRRMVGMSTEFKHSEHFYFFIFCTSQ